MKKNNNELTNVKNKFINFPLWLINGILIIIFLCLQFMNLSYPLLWCDEGSTAMLAQRVTKFGYPKVHDNKNVVFDLTIDNIDVGIDKKTDAFIGGNSWLEFYLATIPVLIQQHTNDLYLKTFILRFPFVLTGIAGLIILSLILLKTFPRREQKLISLACFVLLEIISVSVTLHIREVRYYSLVILLISLFIYVFWLYNFQHKIRYPVYFILLVTILFLMFHAFYPVYFIIIASMGVFEILKFFINKIIKQSEKINSNHKKTINTYLFERSIKNIAKDLFPVLVSLAAVFPFIIFFRIFNIYSELGKFSQDGLYLYQDNLKKLWIFFSSKELIIVAIIIKFILYYNFKKIFDRSLSLISWFSMFLTIIFIVYTLSIAKLPNYLFVRYFIPLQPLLSLILIFDCYLLLKLIKDFTGKYSKVYSLIFYFLLIISGLIHFRNNKDDISGLIYQSTHQYKGCLDYIIPYIKENYKNTDSLIIATNYEESSIMFYLNSKTIIGFVGNNLKQDTLCTPDIIIYRSGWGNMMKCFVDFGKKAKYKKVIFPVKNHFVNNIPELNNNDRFLHQFKTLRSTNEKENMSIYCKVN
jgi:hypothetical protein